MRPYVDTEKTVADFLPQIEKALAYTDTHGVEDVARNLATGQAQLWAKGNGLIVTEVEDTPKARILRFWIAAGDLEDVLRIAEDCYEWGREIGCTRATILGRKGWTRALTGHGWAPQTELVCYTKDLTE